MSSTHDPPEHSSHPEQLLSSSTQLPLEHVLQPEHCELSSTQLPEEHSSQPEHWESSSTHDPLEQVVQPEQELPHVPQLSSFESRSTQEPPHSVSPDGQFEVQLPLEHTSLEPQLFPQLPQLSGSEL